VGLSIIFLVCFFDMRIIRIN